MFLSPKEHPKGQVRKLKKYTISQIVTNPE
jgi:hypothetical protein